MANQSVDVSLKGALAIDSYFEENGERDLATHVAGVRKELLEHIETNEVLYEVIKDGALKYELMLYARTMQSIESSRDVLGEELKDLGEYFWAIAEGSFAFLSSMKLTKTNESMESIT